MQKLSFEEIESGEGEAGVLTPEEFTLVDLGEVTQETKYGTFVFPTDGINIWRI